MTNEESNALRDFDLAKAELIKYGAGSGSAPLSKRRSVEVRYGQTYARLVRLGLKPSLRMKYRGTR